MTPASRPEYSREFDMLLAVVALLAGLGGHPIALIFFLLCFL